MDRKLQALFGLKFNPFAPDIPIEALFVYDELKSFLWRMENIFINEGGFSLITGESGRGKSATLRLLESKLSAHRDLEGGLNLQTQLLLIFHFFTKFIWCQKLQNFSWPSI